MSESNEPSDDHAITCTCLEFGWFSCSAATQRTLDSGMPIASASAGARFRRQKRCQSSLAREVELACLVPADTEHNGSNRAVSLFELLAGRAELDGPVLVEERGRPGSLGAVADEPHPLCELVAPEVIDGG